MAKRRANGEGSITKRKDGTWKAELSLGYVNGKRKRKPVYGRTQREAKEKFEALKQQVLSGTLAETKLTLEQYLKRWHKDKDRQVKSRTVVLYREQAENHIFPRLGSIRLAKVTPMDLQEAYTSIAETVGVRTAELCRVQLHQALKQAVRWQLLPRNPAEAITPAKKDRHEMKIWSQAEATKFLRIARDHELYPLFYVAMSTGLRRGELLGLWWDDLRDTSISVRRSLAVVKGEATFTTPKTARGTRRVEISPDVVEVLERHREKQQELREIFGEAWEAGDLVFTSQAGRHLSPRNLKRSFDRLQKRAKVERVRIQDLRHFHASLAIKDGMNAKMLADRLGHARASFTLDVYTHLFEEQREASAVSISGLMPSEEAVATQA